MFMKKKYIYILQLFPLFPLHVPLHRDDEGETPAHVQLHGIIIETTML